MRDARCHVLPDGINCDRFAFRAEVRSEMRAAYGLDGRFVVGHVGHFTAAKNHEKILRVFAALCRRRQDAALLLVGDGELEADVRRMAQELEIADRVVFAGAMQDVERAYQAMDVFLFPSRYEGFGMAVVEAQASGLACVASDVVPAETNASGRVTYLPLRARTPYGQRRSYLHRRVKRTGAAPRRSKHCTIFRAWHRRSVRSIAGKWEAVHEQVCTKKSGDAGHFAGF